MTEIINSIRFVLETNGGEICHLHNYILRDPDLKMEDAVYIKKRVLTTNPEMFLHYGYKLLKTYNGKALVEQIFSIKCSTQIELSKWVVDCYKTK